jgi:glutamyl-tRNA synthetase
VFDNEKLTWMNGVYIRELGLDEFVDRTLPLVEADLGRGLDAGDVATYRAVAPLIQERMKLLTEAPEQVRFLFLDDLEYDAGSWKKVMTNPESRDAIAAAAARLGGLGEWATGTIEETLRGMLTDLGLNARKGLQPVRVAVTGSSVSPPLFESLEALGRDRSLARLQEALDRL